MERNYISKQFNNYNLIKIELNSLIDYVGKPLLMITPVYCYAYSGDGHKLVEFEEEPCCEWIIYDGTIEITRETFGRTYWAFPEFLCN